MLAHQQEMNTACNAEIIMLMEQKALTSTNYNESSPNDPVWNSVAAGYIAGVSGVIVGHPFESVKVWLQTNTNSNKYLQNKAAVSVPISGPGKGPGGIRMNAGRLSYSGISRGMSTITLQQPQQQQLSEMLLSQFRKVGYMNRKIRALYSGVTGPFFTVGLVQSVNFGMYDSIRRVLHKCDHPCASDTDYRYNDSLTNVAIAGSVTGTVLAFFTAPMVMVKTQQQITGSGFREAFREIFRVGSGSPTASLRSLSNGFGPHFISETMGRSAYYCTYEVLKRSLTMASQNENKTAVSLPVNMNTLQIRMVSAALSGVTCWAIIFPLDAVRSRMYAQQSSINKKTTFEMIRSMYYECGPRAGSLKAFYRGFGVTVLRAGPVAAAVLPIYDFSLEWLSS